jgi:CDP-glucose 4,6-dehydratase
MDLNNFESRLEAHFKGKRVFITGNTGFKGSWLSHWLVNLGAEVGGYSNLDRTEPCLYEDLLLNKRIKQYVGDIADYTQLSFAISDFNPDFVFHLAAQAIVSESVFKPLETFRTNTLGTITLLEVLRANQYQGVAVIVTSDKCYENIEKIDGYLEDDQMGGKDPYSASKGAAEIAISAYLRTYPEAFPKLAIGRAGNVIGGGDWNKNRIIVDCVKAWEKMELVNLRNPESTRPWQHVLEPLSGYLSLAMALLSDDSVSKQAFNFGPDNNSNFTVREVVDLLSKQWPNCPGARATNQGSQSVGPEAKLLSLNCDKAKKLINWESTLSLDETVKLIANWYLARINSEDLIQLTSDQIKFFTSQHGKSEQQ